MSHATPTPTDLPNDVHALQALAATREALTAALRQRILGQDEVVELLLVSLFAEGHALFVGVPGLAKTLLVSSLAQAMHLQFSRVQFTPDLLPADITGSDILEESGPGTRAFRFARGPVFCNLLLADEINRTPPKTQAALLQCMQEGRVTVGGHTHALPRPFHVFATQNPIEHEGTYPLPEAQLDRFTLQITVDYPDEETERHIVTLGMAPQTVIEPVMTPEELMGFQALVRRIPVPPSVVEALVGLVRASRPSDHSAPTFIRESLRFGAGPRAGQQLLRASQARAALRGEAAVSLEDVHAIAPAVLAHRLVLTFAALSRGQQPHTIARELVDAR